MFKFDFGGAGLAEEAAPACTPAAALCNAEAAEMAPEELENKVCTSRGSAAVVWWRRTSTLTALPPLPGAAAAAGTAADGVCQNLRGPAAAQGK